MSAKHEIEITLNGPAAPAPPRYMYVLFTLEHRAYSIDEAVELAESMPKDEPIYCIKIDCGESRFKLQSLVWPYTDDAEHAP